MKITVDIRVNEKISTFDSTDIAVGKIEVEHVGDLSASAIRRTLDDVVEDAVGRVNDQLRAAQKRREQVERDAAEALA